MSINFPPNNSEQKPITLSEGTLNSPRIRVHKQRDGAPEITLSPINSPILPKPPKRLQIRADIRDSAKEPIKNLSKEQKNLQERFFQQLKTNHGYTPKNPPESARPIITKTQTSATSISHLVSANNTEETKLVAPWEEPAIVQKPVESIYQMETRPKKTQQKRFTVPPAFLGELKKKIEEYKFRKG